MRLDGVRCLCRPNRDRYRCRESLSAYEIRETKPVVVCPRSGGHEIAADRLRRRVGGRWSPQTARLWRTSSIVERGVRALRRHCSDSKGAATWSTSFASSSLAMLALRTAQGQSSLRCVPERPESPSFEGKKPLLSQSRKELVLD